MLTILAPFVRAIWNRLRAFFRSPLWDWIDAF